MKIVGNGDIEKSKTKPKPRRIEGAIGVAGGWAIATAAYAVAKAYGLLLGFVPSLLLFLAGFWLTKVIYQKATRR